VKQRYAAKFRRARKTTALTFTGQNASNPDVINDRAARPRNEFRRRSVIHATASPRPQALPCEAVMRSRRLTPRATGTCILWPCRGCNDRGGALVFNATGIGSRALPVPASATSYAPGRNSTRRASACSADRHTPTRKFSPHDASAKKLAKRDGFRTTDIAIRGLFVALPVSLSACALRCGGAAREAFAGTILTTAGSKLRRCGALTRRSNSHE